MSEQQESKAVINVIEGSVGDGETEIPVRFNPTEYRHEKSINYADQNMPGFSSPVTQFVSGDAETLSMELFFDTYENEKGERDVRTVYTNKIDDLVRVKRDIGKPPVCEFKWGEDFTFRGILQSANKRFTMFLSNGTPVRARVDVTFKEYNPPRLQKEKEPPEAPNTKRHRVTQGDSLWSIAATEYDDPQLWRKIADRNDIENPRMLEPGTELAIPKAGS